MNWKLVNDKGIELTVPEEVLKQFLFGAAEPKEEKKAPKKKYLKSAKYTAWSDEEQAFLKEGMAKGENLGSIAKKLNRTRAAVYMKVKQLKKKNGSYAPRKIHTYTDEQVAAIVATGGDKEKLAQIANSLGLTLNAVCMKYLKMRVKQNGN